MHLIYNKIFNKISKSNFNGFNGFTGLNRTNKYKYLLVLILSLFVLINIFSVYILYIIDDVWQIILSHKILSHKFNIKLFYILFIFNWLIFNIILIILSFTIYNKHKKRHLHVTLHLRDDSNNDHFIPKMSHELRTPLNSIIGFSDILLNNSDNNFITSEKSHEYLQYINSSGKFLLKIINDILDFSSIRSNQMTLNMINCDVNRIIESAISVVNNSIIDDKNIKIIFKKSKVNYKIKADINRLQQALVNIIFNSIKFSHNNSKIDVYLKIDSSKKTLSIIIEDYGIGIKKEYIETALASFCQLDNNLNRKYEGIGLGLTLSKELIHLMKGRLKIESTINVGTKISIIFNIY